MFAIVPLIALFIAVGKGFGFDYIIQKWLEDTLVAQKDLIPFIMDFVQKYLETAQGGVFIGIGILILLISVMNFFKQFENAFNNIWEVKKSRSYLRQFTTYFSSLFLIPILVVLSSGISIYLSSLTSDIQLMQLLSPMLKIGMKLAHILSVGLFSH